VLIVNPPSKRTTPQPIPVVHIGIKDLAKSAEFVCDVPRLRLFTKSFARNTNLKKQSIYSRKSCFTICEQLALSTWLSAWRQDLTWLLFSIYFYNSSRTDFPLRYFKWSFFLIYTHFKSNVLHTFTKQNAAKLESALRL